MAKPPSMKKPGQNGQFFAVDPFFWQWFVNAQEKLFATQHFYISMKLTDQNPDQPDQQTFFMFPRLDETKEPTEPPYEYFLTFLSQLPKDKRHSVDYPFILSRSKTVIQADEINAILKLLHGISEKNDYLLPIQEEFDLIQLLTVHQVYVTHIDASQWIFLPKTKPQKTKKSGRIKIQKTADQATIIMATGTV